MLNVKRTWVTWAIVGGLIALLTGFLIFQYNWLVQASDAEREKMQKRVETDTKGFADDFNREIQAAYFNFQSDPKSWERGDWTEFNERFDFWRSKTEFPSLIRSIVYLDTGHTMSLRFNSEKRIFETFELTPELRALRDRIEAENGHSTVRLDGYSLVMPVHKAEAKIERIRISRVRSAAPIEPPKFKMPGRLGSLVIELDAETIRSSVLPALASKHFQDGAFDLRVTDQTGNVKFTRGSQVNVPDTSAKLLTLSPDNLVFFSNLEMLPRTMKSESKAVISQHVESHTFSTGSNSNTSSVFTIQLNKDGEERRQAVFAGTEDSGDAWRLDVQHKAGSIAAFVDGERNRRMLIGSGIYLLVVGAILAIVLSTLRYQRAAQRQIDFVSSVSHEFRTPLAVIYSAGENLADGIAKDREQVSRYGELLKDEGRKLSQMVEQILTFAGARSGQRKYNQTPTDPRSIVERALEGCRDEISENGFEVEVNIDSSLQLIDADATAVSSAIQNLLRNAIKYSNGHRWVRVNVEKRGRAVRFSVEDKGIGIAAGDVPKVFQPFYRAKDVVDSQIHGNGIGLSIVKEITEAHGGTARVESVIGKGSRFTIEIPYL